jgi:putative ABC transport system permease protein
MVSGTGQIKFKIQEVMLRNIFKIAFRNLIKDRFYSLINILGLAIGISASMLILLYITDELSYDRFHKDSERIYRVITKARMSEDEIMHIAVSSAPMADGLIRHIPEVETVTRINPAVMIFNHEGEVYKELNLYYADSTFFDVFSFQLREGNKGEVLRDPYSIVMTEKSAIRYFGEEALKQGSVVGQLIISGEDTYKVTGIVENVPHNSHFDFDFLVSMSTNPDALNPIWLNMGYYTYIKLREGVYPHQLDEKLSGLIMQYVAPQVVQYMHLPEANFTEDKVDDNFKFTLQPLEDIHLKSNLISELGPNGDIQYIYIFTIISIFIILIACINFMNLSTARSVKRAKEVGIRKTLGSDRITLVKQFFFESFIYIVIAMLIGLGLTEAFRGPFNTIAGKNLTFNIFSQPHILGIIALVTIVITLIAASHPALYLTRCSPVQILNEQIKTGSRRSWLRNGLVVFQFMISIALVICTIVVYKQLNYIQNKHLGFEKENVIILNNAWDVGEYKEALKQAYLTNENITSASYATRLPTDGYGSIAQKAEGENESDHSVYVANVDYDFTETLGIEIKQGRFFSKVFASDSSGIVINQAAAHVFGYAGNDFKDAIGKKIEMINPTHGGRDVYEVVGVVADFNFQGLQSEIQPLSLLLYHNTGFLALRTKAGNQEEILSEVERIWKSQVPWLQFDYNFLNEKFDRTFQREARLGTIFSIFTVLAIIVACLGLFGLAAYTAEQRTKEIGIRKTMGASTGSVVNMLNKEFTKLVILSFVLVVPISWYFMNKWLMIFAYKTTIGLWPFLAGGIIALIIAWLTVSYQSIKAAIANPVDSLRNE